MNLDKTRDNPFSKECLDLYKQQRLEKLRRHIEMGYVNGEILPNGAISVTRPKGIQHWYTTAQLVEFVTAAFDRNEKASGRRCCYINNRHQLQIRGKHLRRLLKAMPYVKANSNTLIDLGNSQ